MKTNGCNPYLPSWEYDVVSRMYATPSLMRKILKGTAGNKYKNKPFFQCEYAHAMGNGPGGLEEYMQLFYLLSYASSISRNCFHNLQHGEKNNPQAQSNNTPNL